MSCVVDASNPDRLAALGTIEQMLDYAIVEGAQLRLPLLVYLLRMARLELDRVVADETGEAPPCGGVN